MTLSGYRTKLQNFIESYRTRSGFDFTENEIDNEDFVLTNDEQEIYNQILEQTNDKMLIFELVYKIIVSLNERQEPNSPS